MTIPDAIYVTLAENLTGSLLTDDHRLTRAPDVPVPVLRLPPFDVVPGCQ
jgi:predicted nucleic acid-binding protein